MNEIASALQIVAIVVTRKQPSKQIVSRRSLCLLALGFTYIA
jgi:hypothetical protein